MYEYSIVLPSCSISVISVGIITGAVLVVPCFARCIIAPESGIAIMLILGGLGGVLTQFIKLTLGLLILI